MKYSANYSDNLQICRSLTGLTQKEFINQFLLSFDGKPLISVPTLSNLETKGGTKMKTVINALSSNLSVESEVFGLEPEEFKAKIEPVLCESLDTDRIELYKARESTTTNLLYKLTTYFAEQLFDKTLKKGDRIDSERVLAQKLGVSRAAIRDALKVLEVLGMIDITPGQGMNISKSETNFFIIPLAWSLFLNGEQIESIITVRNVLEMQAAKLAASCTDAALLKELDLAMNEVHLAHLQKDYVKFLDADISFHSCIARCSMNNAIFSMIQVISNLIRQVSGSGMVNAEQMRQIDLEHENIYQSIYSHDPDGAEKAMKLHLEESSKRYNYQK